MHGRWILFTLFLIIRSVRSSAEDSLVPEVCQDGTRTGRVKECAEYLSTMIWKKFTWDDEQSINLCELRCLGKFTGHISRFQWVWSATFQCEGQAPGILGQGQQSKSRGETMEQAMAKTIEEAINFGYLTANDFVC